MADSDAAPAPLSYTVTARTLGGGVAEADPAGTTLRFDASAPGAETGLPGPADLLITAFAGCILKNLERTAQRMSFAYRDAVLHVTGYRQDAPPRMTSIDYSLTISTDEAQRRIDLIHRNIIGFGTIYNTLAAACEITGTITASPTAKPH
jgi:uncharacterized OsmC-like protein